MRRCLLVWSDQCCGVRFSRFVSVYMRLRLVFSRLCYFGFIMNARSGRQRDEQRASTDTRVALPS